MSFGKIPQMVLRNASQLLQFLIFGYFLQNFKNLRTLDIAKTGALCIPRLFVKLQNAKNTLDWIHWFRFRLHPGWDERYVGIAGSRQNDSTSKGNHHGNIRSKSTSRGADSPCRG